MQKSRVPDVLVIGVDFVGLSVALAAQARGLGVLVLDSEGPAAGNAGAFAFTDILPLASPASCARRRNGSLIRSGR